MVNKYNAYLYHYLLQALFCLTHKKLEKHECMLNVFYHNFVE